MKPADSEALRTAGEAAAHRRTLWSVRGRRALVLFLFVHAFVLESGRLAGQAAPRPAGAEATWPGHPLTLKECTELALRQNGELQRAKFELEAAHGLSLQLRSAALPVVKAGGEYIDYRARKIESLPFPAPSASHVWTASVRVIQPIYDGGRIRTSLNLASLTRQEALARFQAVTADIIRDVHTAYFDLLLTTGRVEAAKSAFDLASRQIQDVRSHLGSGLVDRHALLRSEVELGRNRQKLLRAQNQSRLEQTKFLHLLGFSQPADPGGTSTIALADRLTPPEESPTDLALAIERALQQRPELDAQAKSVRAESERVTTAQAGYKPSLYVLGGYGGFNDDFDRKVTGWFAGAQVSWNLFDGHQTRGRVREARARLDAAEAQLHELKRSVALEVRIAHARLTEARELLTESAKIEEMATEGLKLATANHRNGGVSPVDLVSAQHDMTEAHFTTLQALRDYHVARAELDRATGGSIVTGGKSQ